MTLGDGIRRDVATVPQAERDLLLDAFLKLDTAKFYPDGVSYWDKEEDIHKNAHFHGLDVHAGPAFVPWHNPPPKSNPSSQGKNDALCRLLECLLRPEALGRLLTEHHIDPGVLQKCVEVWCRTLLTPASEEELRRREGG